MKQKCHNCSLTDTNTQTRAVTSPNVHQFEGEPNGTSYILQIKDGDNVVTTILTTEPSGDQGYSLFLVRGQPAISISLQTDTIPNSKQDQHATSFHCGHTPHTTTHDHLSSHLRKSDTISEDHLYSHPRKSDTISEDHLHSHTRDSDTISEDYLQIPLKKTITQIKRSEQKHNSTKDWRWWLCFASLMVVCILTALEMTMISTALPSLVADLPPSQLSGSWITSSFLLTMTASQPAFGGLSCVIGRKWSLSLGVLFFLGGSVICALSHSMFVLILGRGVQGVGGGGIQALCEIIVSDMTTLKERGAYVGFIGLVFAIGTFIAPILGGALSSPNLWRWIFWINLPIGAVALAMVIPFMHFEVPKMSLGEKIQRMDLIGNLVLFCSVVGILIGVTEGGINHPWSDKRIYLPLSCGMMGFCLFLAIEFIPNRFCRSPILPLYLFSNRTAAISFFLTFLHGIVVFGMIYTLPVWFQAIKDQKPIASAISTFAATAPAAPASIAAGVLMAVFGKYKLLNMAGWAFAAIGVGCITRYQSDTPKWQLFLPQLIGGIGNGINFAVTLTPIQASLPPSEIEKVTATFAFVRSFGSIWGIAFATTAFTGSVTQKLDLVENAKQWGLSGPTALGFVSEIQHLPSPSRELVRKIFADGFTKSFWIFVPLCIVGFLASCLLKDLELPDVTNSDRLDITTTTTTFEQERKVNPYPLYDDDDGDTTFSPSFYRFPSTHQRKRKSINSDLQITPFPTHFSRNPSSTRSKSIGSKTHAKISSSLISYPIQAHLSSSSSSSFSSINDNMDHPDPNCPYHQHGILSSSSSVSSFSPVSISYPSHRVYDFV